MDKDSKIILKSITNDTIEECKGYIVYATAKLESLEPGTTEYKTLLNEIKSCKQYILKATNFLNDFKLTEFNNSNTESFITFLLIMLDFYLEKKRTLKEEFLKRISGNNDSGLKEKKNTIKSLLRSMIEEHKKSPQPPSPKKKRKKGNTPN